MSSGALLIVLLVAMAWPLKLLLGLLILASTGYTVFCHCLRSLPWSIVMIKVNVKSQMQLIRQDGKQLEVTVLGNTVVTPYLTVLNCRHNQLTFAQRLFSQHIIIFSDAVDAEAYRQLRVYLRWTSFKTNLISE
jgi:toxin CptA